MCLKHFNYRLKGTGDFICLCEDVIRFGMYYHCHCHTVPLSTTSFIIRYIALAADTALNNNITN